MLAAEIEHLLGFGGTANDGTGQALAAHDHAEGVDGHWLFRDADEAQGRVALEELEIGVDVVFGGDGVENEVEAARVLGHLGGILAEYDFRCAEAETVFDLAGRSREEHDMGSERLRELHCHVAEAAETDNANLLPRADFPMPERGVRRDAGAEEGGDAGEIEIAGDLQGESLVYHDRFGVAAQSVAAGVGIGAVVREGCALFAVDFVAGFAGGAGAAGIDHAARSGEIVDLEAGDGGANGSDAADDFMAGDARVLRGHECGPFVASLMEIGVADATKEDFDLYVGWGWWAALNDVAGEGRCGAGGGVSSGVDHPQAYQAEVFLYRQREMMNWSAVGAAFLALAVGLGAFGAHGLKDRLDAYSLGVSEKAVFYHFVHALGILIVGSLPRLGAAAAGRVCWLLSLGILLFSGSLYFLAVSGVRALGAVTPFGGLSFIAAWLVLAYSLWRRDGGA